MDPDANGQTVGGPVADPEDLNGAEEMQCHGADLQGVLVPVADGNTTGHHVGVANGLHLLEEERNNG